MGRALGTEDKYIGSLHAGKFGMFLLSVDFNFIIGVAFIFKCFRNECTIMSVKQIGSRSGPTFCPYCLQRISANDSSWFRVNSLSAVSKFSVLKQKKHAKANLSISECFESTALVTQTHLVTR